MSVALIIRNINPDCASANELIVVTIAQNNEPVAELPAQTRTLPTTDQLATQEQVYWFPRQQYAEEPVIFLNSTAAACTDDPSDDSEYLWFCELDQAG